MRYLLLYLSLILATVSVNAQIIKGRITDTNKGPVIAANVYIKGSYDGTMSDTTGRFSFKTSLAGQQTLVISFIGYQNYEEVINLEKGKEYNIEATLAEVSTRLNDVVITAGTFEASDKKRSIQLKPLEILTTPNSNGDIYSALNTMPGAQIVGEDGALFVRGGEKNETKTFVDGMLVSNPYTSKVPDMPMRGRFSPSLFSGVQFSSGGYSAEYGQALSSALILQTYAYPSQTYTSLSFFPFGAGVNQAIKGDSSAFIGSVFYSNMKPYYSAVSQKTNWTKEPEGWESNLMYRKKFKHGGLLRTFAAGSTGKSGLDLPSYLSFNGNRSLKLGNDNLYVNTVYTGPVFSGWTLKSGIALNYDAENFDFERLLVHTLNRAGEIRLSMQNNINPRLSIKAGGELSGQFYRQQYADSAFDGTTRFNNAIASTFIETEWKITEKLFARTGLRFEYASLPAEFNVSPRISLAFKTGEFSQVSAAFGTFSQVPKDDYVKFAPNLSSEKAIHYILNYQIIKSNRVFRIEGYIKDYKKLVRYTELNDYDPSHYNNLGYGYARGVEVFFRDQKTFKRADYWISYSFLDTRKFYQDLPSLVSPTLFSKHTASAVGKYYFSKIRSQIGITYQYASGRPYEIIGDGPYHQSYTKDFNELSANISYLTRIFNYFTVVHLLVSNILGTDHIYGYHFVKNSSGTAYNTYPIKPAAKRFIVLGIFITLDKQYIQY
jgi:hypothetical protein